MLEVIAMLLALGVWLVLVSLWQKVAKPHPEWPRKLLHMGVGLVGFGFPFVIVDRAPVWLICGTAALAMLGLRMWRPLKKGVGGVLSSVNRVSLGEFYFLLGLPALFTLSQGGALYGTALAVLTFADAAAALVGTFWGTHKFGHSPTSKSLEGTVAFFVVSLAVCLTGLMVNHTPPLEATLTALAVSVMMALLEAVSKDGLDNVLLPVCTYLLLRGLLGLDAAALLVACIIAFTLVAGVAPWHRIRERWSVS
jgi:phytol kinase